MQTIDTKELITFPGGTIAENFSFDCSTTQGNFSFHFKWFNSRWNLWVTLPSGEVRQAGVIPGVTSWSEFNDYGLMFEANTETIDYSSLFASRMYLIKWL